MSKLHNDLASLGRRTGVGRRVHSGAFGGSGALTARGAGVLPGRRTSIASIASLVLATALVGSLAFASAPASAATQNLYRSQFDGSATPQGSFGYPAALAVDSGGDVYVADTPNAVVDKFDASGHYLSQFNGSGTPAGSFSPEHIAVDAAGDVYVADATNAVVDKFDASGHYVSQFNGSGTPAGSFYPFVLAIDSGGDVYVSDLINAVVDKFDPSGHYVSQFNGSETPGGSFFAGALGVDAGGDVYVADVANAVVDRFDPSGHYVSQFGGSEAPQGSFSPSAMALDVGGHVLVGDGAHSLVDLFSPPLTVPDVVTGSASNFGNGSVTLNGTVDPDGVELTECAFEYGTSTAYGQTAPCAETPAEIGTSSAARPVHADLTGLEGDVYHFRLKAANANGSVNSTDETAAVTAAPVIISQAASPTGTEATLGAKINPSNATTSYRFEYGPTPSYGQSTPTRSIPAGHEAVQVSAQVLGLSEASGYHFRVVATNSIETVQGGDQAFTTLGGSAGGETCPNAAIRAQQHATYLGDCRAYEQVSPVDKNGGGIHSEGVVASAPGGAVSYVSGQAFGNANGGPIINYYLGERTSTGWSPANSINPVSTEPGYFGVNAPVEALSADLSRSVVASGQPLTPDADLASNLYLETNASRALLDISPSISPLPADPFLMLGRPVFRGASADFNTVLFQSRNNLTSNAAGAEEKVYEWKNGALHLESVMEDGTAAPAPALAPGEVIFGTSLSPAAIHAVSSDGDRSFFIAPSIAPQDPLSPIGAGPLYMREENGIDPPTTTWINRPQRPIEGPDPAGPQPARFQWATPNASMVFFTSCEKLTEGSTALPTASGKECGRLGAEPVDGGGSSDLYRYNVELEKLTDLTTGDPAGAEVHRVLGASEDGSRVYFTASGNLAPGATGSGEKIYLSDDGTTKLVGSGQLEWFKAVERPYERVSTNGGTLLFVSTDNFTAYDSHGDAEVYVYEAATGELQCASCSPAGPPSGSAFVVGPVRTNAAATNSGVNRSLLPDGTKVFFSSPDPLVPRDTNGKYDAYEYDVRTKQVHLISSGQGNSDSFFADASASGVDVYFTTADQLVGQDQDRLVDLYDARSGGGFASQAAPPPGSPCAGEVCRPQVPSGASTPNATSSGVVGPGNRRPGRNHRKQHVKHPKKHHSSKPTTRNHHPKKHQGRKPTTRNHG